MLFVRLFCFIFFFLGGGGGGLIDKYNRKSDFYDTEVKERI